MMYVLFQKFIEIHTIAILQRKFEEISICSAGFPIKNEKNVVVLGGILAFLVGS